MRVYSLQLYCVTMFLIHKDLLFQKLIFHSNVYCPSHLFRKFYKCVFSKTNSCSCPYKMGHVGKNRVDMDNLVSWNQSCESRLLFMRSHSFQVELRGTVVTKAPLRVQFLPALRGGEWV